MWVRLETVKIYFAEAGVVSQSDIENRSDLWSSNVLCASNVSQRCCRKEYLIAENVISEAESRTFCFSENCGQRPLGESVCSLFGSEFIVDFAAAERQRTRNVRKLRNARKKRTNELLLCVRLRVRRHAVEKTDMRVRSYVCVSLITPTGGISVLIVRVILSGTRKIQLQAISVDLPSDFF